MGLGFATPLCCLLLNFFHTCFTSTITFHRTQDRFTYQNAGAIISAMLALLALPSFVASSAVLVALGATGITTRRRPLCVCLIWLSLAPKAIG
jgi:hypothetical protein